MVEVIKRIDLCYSNASVILTPVQNDAGSRFLVASLTSEGEPYTIPEGCTVQLAVRKPDGTKTLTAASVKGNTVVCELTNQSLAVKGIADAQIIIYNGLAVLKTPPFKLNTFEQIVSDDTIVSTDEFTALSEIMKNYQEISAEVAKKLNKSGGVMSGNIDMAGNKIENITLPVADNDAASKKYVDDKIKYRIINDITITEDISVFSTSQDDNGNAFELQKFFFLFIGKFDTALSRKPLSLSVKKGSQYLMYGEFTVAADTECALWLEADSFLRTSSAVGIKSTYSSAFLRNFSNGIAQGLINNNTSVNSDISLVPVVLPYPAGIYELRFSVHDKTIKMKKGSRFLLLGIDYNA